MDSGLLCIAFSALHQRTSTFLLWGSLPQTHSPCPADPPPCLISVVYGLLFLLLEGRPLRDHQCGTLLRLLHSDSETHFYLFTVNSYTRSQQFPGTALSGCVMLASPLGFQDKLPRSCLSLLPALPSSSPFCLEITLVYHQVQDPGFCFSLGKYSEVKALKHSSPGP